VKGLSFFFLISRKSREFLSVHASVWPLAEKNWNAKRVQTLVYFHSRFSNYSRCCSSCCCHIAISLTHVVGGAPADVGRFRSVRQLGSFFQPRPDPHLTPFHPLKNKKTGIKKLKNRWRGVGGCVVIPHCRRNEFMSGATIKNDWRGTSSRPKEIYLELQAFQDRGLIDFALRAAGNLVTNEQAALKVFWQPAKDKRSPKTSTDDDDELISFGLGFQFCFWFLVSVLFFHSFRNETSQALLQLAISQLSSARAAESISGLRISRLQFRVSSFADWYKSMCHYVRGGRHTRYLH